MANQVSAGAPIAPLKPVRNTERLLAQRYGLRRVLGSGGNCDVFEGVHLVTGRPVAVKLLRSQFRDDAEARARMAQEARAIGSVHHKNVVEILDAEIGENGEPFLALEMLHGRTLEGVMVTRGKLAIEHAVDLAAQIAEGAGALHAAGWVHRDIKPANIFLVQDGKMPRAKLLDLGIAVPRSATPDRRLTAQGTVLGTVAYMAPEQAMADTNVDTRTDVWQIGATLFDMLTGRVPFEGNYANVLVQMSTIGPPKVSTLRPEVPPALEAIVQKALSPKPQDRYEDGAALARALREVDLKAKPAEPDFAQKRRHKRAAFVAPARLVLSDGIVDVRSEDLSEGGMLVLVPFALPQGTKVKIRLSLPISGRVATLDTLVRWVKGRGSEKGQGPFAVGLEFVDLDAVAKSEVHRYVSALGD